jgi:hypothetical protein
MVVNRYTRCNTRLSRNAFVSCACELILFNIAFCLVRTVGNIVFCLVRTVGNTVFSLVRTVGNIVFCLVRTVGNIVFCLVRTVDNMSNIFYIKLNSDK